MLKGVLGTQDFCNHGLGGGHRAWGTEAAARSSPVWPGDDREMRHDGGGHAFKCASVTCASALTSQILFYPVVQMSPLPHRG